MNTVAAVFASFLYLLAGVLLARRLAGGAEASRRSRLVPLLLGLTAVAIHTIVTQQAIFVESGINLAFFNVLSLVMDMVALLVVVGALFRPIENIGIAVLPTAAIAALLQLAAPTGPENITVLEPGLQSHVLLSILSYSLLSIAAVQSVLLAVQDHQLRNRHPGGFIRALPALETMEGLLFQIIVSGYALLTLSLVTGAFYLQDIFAQHLVHKTVLSIVAWVIFTILLLGRHLFGWRGRTAIRWTLGGFVVLMLAYFGSKLVLELVLGQA